jgi:hypothetical protein
MRLKTSSLRVAALAVLVAGAVHLDLWAAQGYRSLHVIGPLFLLNGIAAAAIALLLVARPGPLTAALGLGYAAATLTAFFVSVYAGLFGFKEALAGTAQTVAGAAELAAAVLCLFALAPSRRRHVAPLRRTRARPS